MIEDINIPINSQDTNITTKNTSIYDCLSLIKEEKLPWYELNFQECWFDDLSEIVLENISKTYISSFFWLWNWWNNYIVNEKTYEVFDEQWSLVRNINQQKEKLRKEYEHIKNICIVCSNTTEVIWCGIIMIDDLDTINSRKKLVENIDDLNINPWKYVYIDQLFTHPNFRKLWIWKKIKEQIENNIDQLLEHKEVIWSITRNLPRNIQPYKINTEIYWYNILYNYSDWRVILYRS
jgi:hypothetical protein